MEKDGVNAGDLDAGELDGRVFHDSFAFDSQPIINVNLSGGCDPEKHLFDYSSARFLCCACDAVEQASIHVMLCRPLG